MNRTLVSSVSLADQRCLFERFPAMLCTARFDGSFIEVNEALEAALGYPAGEMPASSFAGLAHPGDRDAVSVAAAELSKASGGLSFEFRCRCADGSYCSMSWNVRADLARDVVYCSARDLTELREHATVVAKLLAELERSNTDLAQLADVASHDLSEPLRMVSSYVQLLAERYRGQLDSDADEFMAYAVDGAARMMVLIDDLLAYSRAGAGAVVRRSVDCNKLVQRALADLDALFDRQLTTGPKSETLSPHAAPNGGSQWRLASLPAPSISMTSISSASRGDRFAWEVLDALPDATAVLDKSGTIIAVNWAWRMFSVDNGGRPDATGVGVNYLDVCTRAAASGCSDASEVVSGLQAVLSGHTVESDREYPCPSPTVGRWFTSRITPIVGPSGGAIASHVNITRRKTSELELVQQASHDSLTGLPNRMLLTDRLATALGARAGRSPDPDVGVLYIDLDDFKVINDTYGHDAGDEVLLNVAYRLRGQVRPQDTVARLGGDEFVVCAPRVTAPDLESLASRIGVALDAPHQVHGQRVHARGSIGLHLATPGDTVAASLQLADRAMYTAKGTRSRAST